MLRCCCCFSAMAGGRAAGRLQEADSGLASTPPGVADAQIRASGLSESAASARTDRKWEPARPPKRCRAKGLIGLPERLNKRTISRLALLIRDRPGTASGFSRWLAGAGTRPCGCARPQVSLPTIPESSSRQGCTRQQPTRGAATNVSRRCALRPLVPSSSPVTTEAPDLQPPAPGPAQLPAPGCRRRPSAAC